jgi:hypothetical protein
MSSLADATSTYYDAVWLGEMTMLSSATVSNLHSTPEYSPKTYYDDTMALYRKDIESFYKWSRILGIMFVGLLCLFVLSL